MTSSPVLPILEIPVADRESLEGQSIVSLGLKKRHRNSSAVP